MSKEIEQNLEKIPIVNMLVRFGKKIKIPGLEGMSLYDVLEMYGIGIVKGALTTRAGGIAFSFFMAIFPFALFILTLIPYIPIEGFQDGLFSLIQDIVPPKTFKAVDSVLHDIIKNQYGGLLSFGFIASMFLMTNGVNAIFGGFEYSYHVKEYRSILRAYFVSLGVSLLMTLFLIVAIVSVIFYQVALAKIDKIGWLDTSGLDLFYYGRAFIFLIMIFIIVSLLFRYGTKEGKHVKFFSAGALLTTILMLFSFYLFGIYVLKFARYNELYGSIGTLLIVMLFVWLNSIILLLGFELNATLGRLKRTANIKNVPVVSLENSMRSENPIQNLKKYAIQLQNSGATKEEIYEIFHEYLIELKGNRQDEITLLDEVLKMIPDWYVGNAISTENEHKTS